MRRITILKTSALLLCAVVLTGPAVCAAEDYWPGWMGPERNGWVSQFQSIQWPEQLSKRWQVEVGTGYATPLVANGRVYQHARQDEDEVVWCLDLDTGRVLWRQSDPVSFKIGGGADFHGKGPKSSPVLSDGRVFTLSMTGVLTARNAETGEQLWRRDESPRFQPNHPYWGAATSPLVDGKHIVVHLGNDDKGALVALDVETGQVVWELGPAGPSYSSPLLVEMHGVRQIVEWNHLAIVGVDSVSGRQLWEFPFPHVGSDQNMPTPVFHKGRVLVGGENRGLLSLEPQLQDGVWKVTPRWHQKDIALDMSSAVINDDLLYGHSHYNKGQLFCLEPENGAILWQSPGRIGDHASFLSIPGYVLALIHDGRLQVIKADEKKLAIAASWRVSEEPAWAPPVLLQDGVLIKDKQTLTLWSFGNAKSGSVSP